MGKVRILTGRREGYKIEKLYKESDEVRREIDEEDDGVYFSPECVITVCGDSIFSRLKEIIEILDVPTLRFLVEQRVVNLISTLNISRSLSVAPKSSECIVSIDIRTSEADLEALLKLIANNFPTIEYSPDTSYKSTVQIITAPKSSNDTQHGEDTYTRNPLLDVTNAISNSNHNTISKTMPVHKGALGKIIGMSAERIKFIRQFSNAEVWIKTNLPVAYASVLVRGSPSQVSTAMELISHYLKHR